MDLSFWHFTALTWGALAAILNPVGILPQFIAFTSECSVDCRRVVARRSVLFACGVLMVSSLVGSGLFSFFGVTLGAFRIAGGVLLFLIAIDMLHVRPSRATTSPEEHAEGVEKSDVSIFPVAIPLIAGPGSITTAIVLGHQAGGGLQRVSVVMAIAGCMLGLYICLRQASAIADRLGKIGMNMLTRVMGLLLAAIACQFILDGLSSTLFREGRDSPQASEVASRYEEFESPIARGIPR